MALLRLLQFSDLHLGSPAYAASLGLPDGLRSSLGDDLLRVLDRLVDLALDREVDGVLVPGDLFDDEAVDAVTVDRAAEAFDRLAPRPVFIAPGNHDPYRVGGYYAPTALVARGRRPWPEHVVVFRDEGWTTLPWPGRSDVQVTGTAYLRPATTFDRRLGRPIERPPSPVSLLMVHGSRDGFAPPGKRITLPFSEPELLAQGFTYAALGHYHESSRITDDEGVVRGAYAGCPQGRGLDETGPRGALLVSVEDGSTTEVELVPIAERTVHRLGVSVGRASGPAAVLDAVERAVRDTAAGSRDLVVAEVEGRLAPGEPFRVPEGFLDGLVASITVVARGLRPDYDLEGYRAGDAPPTTETRFARRLLDRIAASSDEAEREILRDALDIGLDALHGHRIPDP